MLQNILFEVERYKRQKCQDSDLVYYTRLKELQHEEDWGHQAEADCCQWLLEGNHISVEQGDPILVLEYHGALCS